MSSNKLPSHVQYRNGTYYGLLERYQRNGYGLLVLDNSQIILAQWKKNIIHGKYVYIADGVRAYGNMLNGKLDGYNIIWMRGQDRQDRIERTVYGMFREDKLYGKAIVVANGNIMVSQFVNSELKEVISKSTIKDRQVYDALTQHYPKNMYTMQQFLLAFMKEAANYSQEEQEIPRYQPVVVNMGEEKLFGYEQCFNKGRRYGFILRQNQVLSIGQHLNNSLEGIGRFYGADFIEDGIFKDGYLKGIGIKYYKLGNKYTIGEHDGKSTLEKGFGFPNRQICEIRKEFHLRSIYFYNDIIMLGMTSHLTTLMNNIIMEGKPKRNESPKFPQEYRARSPAQTKLYKYDVEQDQIEDSSPIKGKFSEYKPVDQRGTKYFTLDKEEQQYEKKRLKQKSISPAINTSNYRQSRNTNDRGDKQIYQTNSRFKQEDSKAQQIRPDPYSRSRGANIAQNRDRSGTRNNARSGVKDTRELVRQLEQQQKKKRLDLDKIYRQAGLYRKK